MVLSHTGWVAPTDPTACRGWAVPRRERGRTAGNRRIMRCAPCLFVCDGSPLVVVTVTRPPVGSGRSRTSCGHVSGFAYSIHWIGQALPSERAHEMYDGLLVGSWSPSTLIAAAWRESGTQSTPPSSDAINRVRSGRPLRSHRPATLSVDPRVRACESLALDPRPSLAHSILRKAKRTARTRGSPISAA